MSVTDPGPPDRDEQESEAREAVGRGFAGESKGELGDGYDEDEVEEELEPTRAALPFLRQAPDVGRPENVPGTDRDE